MTRAGSRGRWEDHRERRRDNRRARREERRAGRPRHAGPPSGSELLGWRLGDLSDTPWCRGALVAAALYVFLVGASGLDFYGYRGEPVETTVVVSVEISGTERVSCGRSFEDGWAEVVTYESLTTRPGYPDVFRSVTCPGTEEQPGDEVTVVRTGVGDEYVFPDPLVTYWQWLTWPIPFALVVGLVVTLGFVVREEWYATRWAVRLADERATEAAEERSVEAAVRRVELRRRGARIPRPRA
ncbi:hypothetical protein [Pseudokineococcus sp. 1T1Z-3]|uniref:hypothetical protein n=1 Tax=Pseudokineococcus sp. 1T1Z-3 TaxID=3132745 RepID=UPI0030AE291C